MGHPGTTHQQPVLLWNGRIPQLWDLPTLRKLADEAERCTAAPDPVIASYYRQRQEGFRALIDQTEKGIVS